MKKCGGMFDFDRKSGREADREKRDRFVIINSSEGRQKQRHYPVLFPGLSLSFSLSMSSSSDQIKIIITTRLSFITFIHIP